MRERTYDVAAFLARLGVGVVFIAHGWQKLEAGITATGRSFDDMGVPAPTFSAAYAAFAELLGGAALIAGIGLPVAGTLLFLDMAGALVFVHADNGLFLVDGTKVKNGYELVLVLGLASLVFALGGGGRLTLDTWLSGRRRRGDRDRDDFFEPGEQTVIEAIQAAERAETVPVSPAPELPAAPKKAPAAPPPPPRSAPEGRTVAEAATATEPRTAAEILDDDKLVAGRRRKRRSPSSTTQPIKRDHGGKPEKDDSSQ
ncbi:DoxX family protein [Actinomadura barringtoniae]|uniref:DoxX family protein n=1 Tax=Actinomadura barringtoniae TaxID=1427535 RepID=A0A939PNC2_9ACTN|nr:DoxX family protein [Actinomadura barringtoniae]MBO2451741.1 DoxX family protein [Actinomadura barringtoniae]